MKKIVIPVLALFLCMLFFAVPDSVSADDPSPDVTEQQEQLDQDGGEGEGDQVDQDGQDGILQSGVIEQMTEQDGSRGDITWSLDADYVLRIDGNGRFSPKGEGRNNEEMKQFQDAAAQARKAIVGEGITSIGSGEEYYSLLLNCTQLKEAALPSTLTIIGGFIGCSALNRITFPNGCTATVIDWLAFADCSSLKSFTIPSSVRSIYPLAFRGSGITKISVPSTVTFCDEMLSGSKIKEITWNASTFGLFYGTEYLERIIFGKNLKKISTKNPMEYCPNVSSIVFLGPYDYNSKLFDSLSDVVIYRKNGSSSVAIEEATAGTKTITIPSKVGGYKVTKIGDYAFDGNKYVRTVSVPSSVTAIGSYAFYNCSKLNKLTLRSGLKSVGKFAFYGCNSLESLKLPATVTSIGERAFWNCYSLKSLALPPSIETIGANAFESCTGLTAVNVGSTTVSQVILEKIATPVYAATAKATKVKSNAFKNCKKLKKVTIGTRVNYIGANAFRNCKKLKTIKIKTKKLTAKKVGSNAFKGIYKKATFKVPSKKLKSYKKILRKKGATKKMKFKKL